MEEIKGGASGARRSARKPARKSASKVVKRSSGKTRAGATRKAARKVAGEAATPRRVGPPHGDRPTGSGSRAQVTGKVTARLSSTTAPKGAAKPNPKDSKDFAEAIRSIRVPAGRAEKAPMQVGKAVVSGSGNSGGEGPEGRSVVPESSAAAGSDADTARALPVPIASFTI
jgi:hypothetical protein